MKHKGMMYDGELIAYCTKCKKKPDRFDQRTTDIAFEWIVGCHGWGEGRAVTFDDATTSKIPLDELMAMLFKDTPFVFSRWAKA